ncbi:MAG: hypothetical protein ABIP03_03430 [Aquihabitans sp.]
MRVSRYGGLTVWLVAAVIASALIIVVSVQSVWAAFHGFYWPLIWLPLPLVVYRGVTVGALRLHRRQLARSARKAAIAQSPSLSQ